MKLLSAERVCLRCQRKFPSTDSGHRICGKCVGKINKYGNPPAPQFRGERILRKPIEGIN